MKQQQDKKDSDIYTTTSNLKKSDTQKLNPERKPRPKEEVQGRQTNAHYRVVKAFIQ